MDAYSDARRPIRFIAAVILPLLLSGCPDSPLAQPEDAYTPDVVGPIEEIRQGPERTDRIVVVDGEEIVITNQSPRALGSARLDGLLLLGDDAGGWFMTVGQSSTGPNAGCYQLASDAAFDDGGAVVFALNRSEGIALPKHEDFEMPREGLDAGGRYPPWLNSWCLNSDGEVVSAD